MAKKAIGIGKQVYEVAKPAYELYKTIRGGSVKAKKTRRGKAVGGAVAEDPFNIQSIGFQQTGGQIGSGFFSDFVAGVRKRSLL